MFVMERKSLLNDKRIAMKTYVQPQTKTLAVRPLLLSASTEGKTETMPLNPGDDPSLPLYEPWPLYDAIRAANAEPQSAWTTYADVDTTWYLHPESEGVITAKPVYYMGPSDSPFKQMLDAQGVVYAKKPQKALVIIDASSPMPAHTLTEVNAADAVWLWGITPETVQSYEPILTDSKNNRLSLHFDRLARSSFLLFRSSWFSTSKCLCMASFFLTSFVTSLCALLLIFLPGKALEYVSSISESRSFNWG